MFSYPVRLKFSRLNAAVDRRTIPPSPRPCWEKAGVRENGLEVLPRPFDETLPVVGIGATEKEGAGQKRCVAQSERHVHRSERCVYASERHVAQSERQIYQL